MRDAIDQLQREAANFVRKTTKDSGDVAWFGPLLCDSCFGNESGILFVSVELLKEVLGARELTRETMEAANKTLASELLTVCLREKHRALAGEVDDINPNNPEAVAAHIAASGVPVVVRHNEQYRGFVRLMSQQTMTNGDIPLHGFILCKAAKPEPEAKKALKLVVQLRGCSVDVGNDAPLFRPLSRLLVWGPPPGQIAFVFLAPRLDEHNEVRVEEIHKLEQGERREDDIRYFGGFVMSEGRRVLFFPGIPRTAFSFGRTTGEEATKIDNVQLDHLTLEATHDEWHITAVHEDGRKAGKDVYDSPTMRTNRISHTLIHWFSLGADSGELFYKMARENPLEMDLPEVDFERRALEASRSIRQASYHMTPVAENRKEGGPGFWYFETLISTIRGENVPRDKLFAIPAWMGETTVPVGEPFHVAERRIHIPGFEGEVILLGTRLPGTLKSPLSFGFPVVVPTT